VQNPEISSEELGAWLRLAHEPGLSAAQTRLLLARFGLPQHVYAASVVALCRVVPEALALQLRRAPDDALAQRMADGLAWLDAAGHTLLTLADPDYPRSLLDLSDPPVLLYVHGNVGLLSQPAIAMVGARNATAAGLDNARAFAAHLARAGWCIVSGLAHGIDAAAHRGALSVGEEGAGTVAVLGTGIDRVYPAHHRDLAADIARVGALVSEFPLGAPAVPHHFPRRNRLVAALARGVLVVEAARQSGSRITARHALDIGREVFAIPGSIHSPLSRGCHALIRQGAKLVESARDIDEELGAPSARSGELLAAPASVAPEIAPLGALPQRIVQALGYDPIDVLTLQQRTQLPLPVLTANLATLELDAQVVRLADGRFQRRHPSV